MPEPPRALVVEDAADGRFMVSALLANQGFTVDGAEDAETGLGLAREHDPDLVVMDVGLPGLDGISACRSLRGFSDAYVLMLTARDGDADKVIAFAAGADDYITKPFSIPEFLGRVAAVMRRPRRSGPPSHGVRRIGALAIDVAAREARLDGAPLDLTRTEFDLLEALSARPGIALSRAELLAHVWGFEWSDDDHLVETHMSNLRRKLRDDPRAPTFIRTIRGIGYRMTGSDASGRTDG